MHTYPLTIGDKTYELKFTARNLGMLEQVCGQSIFLLIRQGMGVNLANWLLWAGLRFSQKGISYDKAAQLLDKWLDDEENDLESLLTDLVNHIREQGYLGKAARKVDLGNVVTEAGEK